jgi:hypothetical protein
MGLRRVEHGMSAVPVSRRLFLACLWAGATPHALAQQRFEGHTFEARARVAGSELVLNGVGVRAVAWFKGYAAGLYVAVRGSSAADLVGQPGPKRLQIVMLVEVPAVEFVKAFRKGVERNSDSVELQRIAAAMVQFENLVAGLVTLHKGDVVTIDLEPERGTVLRLNGTVRGEPVAPDALFAALLRSFVGEHPYDTRLKAGMLGLPA